MLQRLVNLIALVATIAKLPPDDYDEVNAKIEEYEAAKADIKQFHGDEGLAQPQVLEQLDEVVKIARVVDLRDIDGDGIISDQEAAAEEKKESGGEGGEKETETAEDLVKNNTAPQLRELAEKEGVDLGDATRKEDVAAKIIEAREVRGE